jgi:nitrite reductase (NADH) small subunit
MTLPLFPATEDGFIPAALIEELPVGEARMVRLTDRHGEDRLIALYNVAGTVYATDNSCPHSGGPLGKGLLRGEIIICPWHMWSFNVKTGVCDVNPEERIDTYPVAIKDGRILVKI